MQRFITVMALAIIAALLSAPAAAQQRRINVPASATWGHARSGVALPPAIGDLRRAGIAENLPGEVDVSAHYGDDITRVSIILFRPQTSDVGLWFDVSETVLGQNPNLRDLRPTHATPLPFATVAGGPADALRQSWTSSGQWTATGTAIIPVGRWLVKIRASSSTLDLAQIDALIDQAIAAIRLPATRPAGTPVRVVMPCADSPRWRRARQVDMTMEDALLGSTGALVMANGPDAEDAATGDAAAGTEAGEQGRQYLTTLNHPTLCRGEEAGQSVRLYRVPGDDVRYWIMFGDAGTYVAVEPSLMGMLSGGGGNRVLLTMVTPLLAGTLAAFNRLPTPEQAYQAASTGRPMVTASFDPEMEAVRTAPPPPPPVEPSATPPASPPASGA